MSVINTNVKALAAQESSRLSDLKMGSAMEKLSTGQRINSAKDDAAGLSITTRMSSQIRGYAVAIRNANDGMSMSQTAEGALGQVTSMLQRMRELSVQAANGALANSDRSSIQTEINQLKKEINNIAVNTNHNSIKLLDGSAKAVAIQTGVNNGDAINLSFGSVQTKDLGQGQLASLTSMAATTSAAQAGDMLINGVEVGASLASDDVISSGSQSASAIAKAAAINRVSAQSGVVATVGQTTKYGATQSSQAVGSGTITVNGVTTATTYVTGDAAVSRQAVVRSINAISSQTGVQAIDTNDDNHGVVLVAADGRNVVVTLNTLSAGQTGLANGTAIGTIDLNSTSSSQIVLGSKVNGTIGNFGFRTGTYTADQATAVTKARAVATTAASVTTTGVLNGSALIINDITIDAAVAGDDTASVDSSVILTSSKAASAIAIAAAINKKSSLTGVTATAMANVVQGDGTFSVGAITNASPVAVQINGVSIGSINALSTRDSVMGLINAKTGQTGVTALADADGLKLVAADGRNINIASDATANSAVAASVVASALGLTNVTVGSALSVASTYYSTVSLSSDRAFTLRNGSESDSNANFGKLGFDAGTFGGSHQGLKIDKVDASTIAGASSAITAIDAAITNVASMQSVAGAYQNRLEAIVSNLNESNQNMSAARSRLLDTDYATETTNLAKAQIIQQAATAMLAQANQSSQTVLALLK